MFFFQSSHQQKSASKQEKMNNAYHTHRKSDARNALGQDCKTTARSQSTAHLNPAPPGTNSGAQSAQYLSASQSQVKTHHEAPPFSQFQRNKHFVLIDQQQRQQMQMASNSSNLRKDSPMSEDSVLEENSLRDADYSRSNPPRLLPVAKPSTIQPSFYVRALRNKEFQTSQQRLGNFGSECSSSQPSGDAGRADYRRPSLPHSNPANKRSQPSSADGRKEPTEQSVGGIQRMQNRDSEMQMNSTQEFYQPSQQDSCETQEKLDQILEKIMTGSNPPQINATNCQLPGGSEPSASLPAATLGRSETRMLGALGSDPKTGSLLQRPFQKCIDKVLSYSELADVRIKQLDKPMTSYAANALESLPAELTEMVKQMTFLVKFRGISHLHCQWMPGMSIVENCDAASVQTLIQFLRFVLQNKEKLEKVNYSSDEQLNNSQPQNMESQTFLSSFLQSKKATNLLDIQSTVHPFFNPDYLKVEQVLCTSTMYPLLHQSGIQQVANSWKDECLRVLDVLLNIQKDSTSFGLKFSAFDPAFGTKDLEQKGEQIDGLFGQSALQVVNMTQLQNLLYNKGLARPYQFWVSLGKIFKAFIIVDEDEQSPNRQFCALLRTLALYLFRKWQRDCTKSYQSFVKDLSSSEKRLDEAFSLHQIRAGKNRAERHKQQISNQHGFQQSISGNGARNSNDFQGREPANQLQSMNGANEMDERGSPEDSSPPKIKLDDLQLFQNILNQNEKILSIQTKLNFTQDDNQEVESLGNTLNLFMENQKLLQNLLMNFQKQHPLINLYEKDIIVARSARIGSNDQELTELRNKLLGQNSFALEKMTRRKILGSSDSGSTSQHKNFEKALISGSDCSSLEKAPIFIFNLLQNQQNGGSPLPLTSVDSDPAKIEELKFNEHRPLPGPPRSQSKSDEVFFKHQIKGMTNTDIQMRDETTQQQAYQIQQQNDKLNVAQQAMEDLTASKTGTGGSGAEFFMLQATIKSFLSQAKQLSSSGNEAKQVANLPAKIKSKANHQGSQYQDQPIHSTGPSQRTQTTQQVQEWQNMDFEQNNTTKMDKNGAAAPQAVTARHELSWLLFEGETENEILANPYIFEDDVETLLQGLFEKEQSQEGDSGQSFDIQSYYLNRMHLQGARPSMTNQIQQVREFDCLSFEPLFLIKWKLLSYAEISWEPLSALKGDNLRQVKEFLAEKRQISMRGRLLNSKMISNQAQLLRAQQELLQTQEIASSTKIFSSQKKILDVFIQSLMKENAAQRNSDEVKSLHGNKGAQDTILKSKNFKLLELQKRSLNSLEQAFFANKNVILADQKGLGKRVTLINFLNSLKFKHKISGPFLIITTEAKLAHWRYLLDKWTELKTLIYHDEDKGQTGMENLRKWAVYHLDVTIKGRMTTRNQLHTFDVMLTIVDHINNEEDIFLRNMPFMQVIVDNAEIPAQREATRHIACKRIICSTSNPMQGKVNDLADLVRCIDPKAMDKLANPESVFDKISSLAQVQSLWGAMSPYMIKNFQYEQENLFGQLNQIEIDAQMTPCQRLFYKEIYKQHGDLITKLSTLDQLSSSQVAQIETINDQLLKCCNSIFLIDQEEKLFQKCHQFSKRELKSNLKQQLVSGKMLVLQQIVENLQKSSKKMIICSHYPNMLLLLKKYFKETGVACFMYQPSMSIDSVFRFNLYSGQAVFLYHIGQKWTKQECSYFDLDFIQNVVIFDQFGAHENDLINLFQVCTLPFSIDVNIYRLISENSYEQKIYQRQCRSKKIQNVIFNQRNLWHRRDLIQSMRLEFPLQLGTTEECSDYTDISQIPIHELDLLFKLSAEQVVIHLNSRKQDRKVKGKTAIDDPCFTQNYIELLTQQEKPPQLQILLDKAKAKNSQRNGDRLMDLHDNLKSLDESIIPNMPPLKSSNFYYKIFGLDYGVGVGKEQTCNHVTCSHFFIEKLSDSSNLISKNNGQSQLSSFSKAQAQDSNKISLIKLLKIQGQLGRQHKQKTLFSLDFMKQSSQGNMAVGNAPFRGQPLDKIWKNMNNTPADEIPLHLNENDNDGYSTQGNNQLKQQTNHKVTLPIQLAHLPGNSQLAQISGTPNNGKLLTSINRIRQGATPQDQLQLGAMVTNGGEAHQMLVDNSNGVVVGSQAAIVGHNLDTQAYGSAGHGKRKSHSEQGQQDQQQFNYDEDIKILKCQKKTSENNTNTLKQSLDQQHVEQPNDESDDRTIEMQVEDEAGQPFGGLNLASGEHSDEIIGPALVQNQPDKKLSNGNVCQICFFLVDDKRNQIISKEPVLKCEGSCKNIYHGECARQQGLIMPGSIKPILQKAKPGKPLALQLKSAEDNNVSNDHSQELHPKKAIEMESFLCICCHRNEASCYICKKFGSIGVQTQPKEKIIANQATMPSKQIKIQSGRTAVKSPASGNDLPSDQVEKYSQLTLKLLIHSNQVEKCIVGSCQKYYHFGCLQQNQNVDIYTNNKNQTRFRCPLHYCSGCSISGNSVQILQCVACPTSYHLKCFRADRGAVKLTKKFILCGQHVNLLKKMQRKRNGQPAKTSIAGYSLQQKIEQHKRHYLQQMQIRKNSVTATTKVNIDLQHPGSEQQHLQQINASSKPTPQLIGVKQTYVQHNKLLHEDVALNESGEMRLDQLDRPRDFKADLKALQRRTQTLLQNQSQSTILQLEEQ